MRSWPVLLLCLVLCSPGIFARAAGASVDVQKALEKLDATDLDEDWHFTMEVVEDEELLVIESDPSRGRYERRQLVTVNGEAPDTSRQETFREAEKKRIDALDPDNAGYGYLVDVTSLKLVEELDGLSRYTFLPRVKDLGDSREALRGTLLLSTETGQVDRLEIHNTAQLSPAFSVTVDTYRLVLSFGQEQGANLLRKLESRAVGTAGFVKSFDSAVDVSFRDYRRVTP